MKALTVKYDIVAICGLLGGPSHVTSINIQRLCQGARFFYGKAEKLPMDSIIWGCKIGFALKTEYL